MKQALAFTAFTALVALLMAQANAATHGRAKTAAHRPKPEPQKHEAAPAQAEAAADVDVEAKVVHYGERDVVKLKTKIRMTTLIVLPKNEQILEVTCGDKDYWIVNGNQNFAYIKPAKPGALTNLNLVTASGNVYTFVLAEVSDIPTASPDLKVFVEPKEESMLAAIQQAPRFVASGELDSYRHQVDIAREEVRRIKQDVDTAVQNQMTKFLDSIRFSYRFEPDKGPFHVQAIFHDDKFTYIRAQPDETPTLYELRDGKPNLVNFEFKKGVYVADKIIERGYLAIGKERLVFIRREDHVH